MIQNVALVLLSMKRKWYMCSSISHRLNQLYKQNGFNNGLRADLTTAA